MEDFPEIDMSIGEYYKLLLEGRRPMRNRNARTTVGNDSSTRNRDALPTSIGDIAGSSRLRRNDHQLSANNSHNRVNQLRRRKGSDSSSQESEEEKKSPVRSGRDSQNKAGGLSFQVKRSQSSGQTLGNKKRLEKAKDKLGSKKGGTIGQQNQLRHHGKPTRSQMTLSNTISVKKSNLLRIQDDGGGIGSDVLRLQQQTNSMIQDQIQKEKALKEAQKPEKDLSQEREPQFEKHKEEKKIVEKFEYIDPHPLYCVDRYVINSTQNKSIQKIDKVDEATFELKTKSEESGRRQQLILLSKVFFVKIQMLESVPAQLQEQLIKGSSQTESNIVIIQKLTKGREDNQVDFVTPIQLQNGNYQAVDIKIKEQINYQKDLKDFEAEVLGPYLKSAYNKELTNQISEFADKVQKSFMSYFNDVKAIELNKNNLESLLFSIVSYEPISGDKSQQRQKLGIFLRAKYDPFYQDYVVFLRLLNCKVAQKERTDWFPLSKFSIKADLTRGFVSLDYLSSLENINNATQKLKMRMFEMVSFQESQLQQATLRSISNVQDHSEGERPAKTTIEARDERCSTCNYITNDIEHLKCSNCSKNYHLQCLKLPNIHSNLGLRETDWRCQDCIRCTNCLSLRNRDSMLICQKCNAGFHYDCLDQSVKQGVPSISNEKDLKLGIETRKTTYSQLNQFYKCEQCVECENCGSKEAGEKRNNKWSKDYKLCTTCNKKRSNKEFCLVCEKFWPDTKEKQDQLQTIQCVQCLMCVHQDCDRIFKNPNVLQQFSDGSLKYNCQKCRQNVRLRFISEIIEKLASEDKMYFYQEPVEGRVQNYTKIIKTPMCFKYVREKISEYVRNPEILKSDINLIFQNAITFNQPKHKVHKDAIRMKDLCNNILSKFWGRIEKNKLRTLDEDSHQQRIVEEINATKQGKNYKIQPDEEVFMLQAEDLLEPSEHIYNFPVGPSSSAKSNFASNQLSQRKDDQFANMDESENDQNYVARNARDKMFGAQNSSVNVNADVDMESDDQNASPGNNNDPHNLLEMRDANLGISKNLRVRKQINYNEDRLLAQGSGILGQSSNDQALSGNKRQFSNAFKSSSNIEVDQLIPPLSIAGNSIKNLKRQRQNQFKLDPDFIPPGTSTNFKPQSSAASLLTQALNQDNALISSEINNDRNETKAVDSVPVNHIQQQQQMMMSYYQEIDDEKCYYSNPARCSFDDPSLLFEEMCYLCGSFGNGEDFLSCTLCGESFHTYCLQLPEDQVSKYQQYWKCLNCKFCEICASATQEAFLLYCDVCDKAFHSFCLKPQLKSIPNCQWKCQECFKCQQCGTKEFFSAKDNEEKRNLEVTDFEFSQNFSFCYQCGKNEYKKSFCKICQKKTEDSDSESKQENPRKNKSIHSHSLALHQRQSKSKKKSLQDQMMKCNECGFYSHFRCSKLLPPALGEIRDQDIETNPEILKEYKCLECLLAGKTINHLIRETCEQYENIHQIISRQKLLASLCSDILSKYFPIQDKAPLFIKSFITQNYDFFRKDKQINDWLELLESNVCLESADQGTQDTEKMQDLDEDVQENSKLPDDDQIASAINQEERESPQITKVTVQDGQQERMNIETSIANQNDFSKQQKQFSDVHLEESLQKFDKNQIEKNKPQTKAMQVYDDMYGCKQTFLPEKRNLYKSLSQGDQHRFGQRDLFMQPSELSKLITVPTEENLAKINFSELYVQVEFKAVMRIKFHFFKWFEELIKQILRNNSKFIKTDKKISGENPKKSIEEQEDLEQIAFNYDQVQINTLSQKNHASEDELCTLEDTLVQNPQVKLQCVLCRLFGEYTVTGRLIPFQVNQFVHVNCAVWSTDVYEIGDGQLVNFFFVQNGKSRTTKCVVCNETGATVICFTRKCNQAFHFPCAYRENRVAFLRSKETYCDYCTKSREFQVGYLQDMTTKRRFQIARNQIPWNMSIMYQPPPGQQVNPFLMNTQLFALQQTQVALNNVSNPTDMEKPLQIEKWRPFYFDMFNRVGNLTVLSLKKEINFIIEETIYGTKKEINMDDLTDFAAIRVYWKFYKDYLMNDQEEESINPLNLRKSYFMFSNNTIREVNKNDLNSLVNYSSEKIREKIQIGIHYNQAKNLQIHVDEGAMTPINQTMFWQKIMQHFQRERPNFTLQNIIFSISEFGGKTKYPISVWNRAEVKNKGFFLKSGNQVLSQQNQTQDRDSQTQQSAKKFEGKTVDDIFKRMIKINQMGDNQNPMISMKRLTSSKHMKYENMLSTLGKKMFYSKSHQDEINENKNQQKSTVLAKKIRLTDTIDTNKEIDLPIAMKYRLSKAQPKRVEVGPSKIHRNGLFTLEDLMPGDIVIEYVGEKIRNKVADKREIYYEQKGIGDCYLFRLDKEYIIDATFFGNKARYLNHSCDANCSAKIINVQQQKHIIISTNRQIKSGEELTYNYNFDYETDKIACFCGAPTCSGRLN